MQTDTPWHRASWEQFLKESLPQLLAPWLPPTGYRIAAEEAEGFCTATWSFRHEGEGISFGFMLPWPDADGVFLRGTKPYVVLPTASQDELDLAEIQCVGEQFADEVAARLREASEERSWDELLAAGQFSLGDWAESFLERHGQALDTTNALSRLSHLRRIEIPNRTRLFTPGHFGRVCPIESPENPNIGRVLAVARGATIRDGRLLPAEDAGAASLGLCAALIPFLEHGEPCRLTMGANMLRQWQTPPDPEPALVRTGFEVEGIPDAGRNLVSAFVPWGLDSFEDAIVLSESCAARFAAPQPIQPGDKLSNRHGAKGVVSRVLPDAQMPHLPDGTAVDLVYDSMGLYSRLNFGLVREALMGRIAAKEGQAALVPPFAAPSESELRARLRAAGLPEDGLETIREGRDGVLLERRGLVGVVYWGRLVHTAERGYFASVLPQGCQRQGELEAFALRSAGALENLREHFQLRASESSLASTLAERVGRGEPLETEFPSPRCAELLARLAAAGIAAHRTEQGLTFGFAPPSGERLELAQPMAHPWLPGTLLTEIGRYPACAPEFRAVAEADARLLRLAQTQAPSTLRERAVAELETAVRRYLNTLVPAAQLRQKARPMFQGRAVAAPGSGLNYDQVGIPEEMAWTLFRPLLRRSGLDAPTIEGRGEAASRALDALMGHAWVLVHRAPVIEPTGFLAFHPVRSAGQVIRLHPLANHSLNADFDGDILAVYLPLTEAAQQEAGERLSLAGHLRREPELLANFLPLHASRAGLALLSRTPEGREQIRRTADLPEPLPPVPLNRAGLLALAAGLLSSVGAEATLSALHRLTLLGFAAGKRSGLSLSPFLGVGFSRPEPPHSTDPEFWQVYTEETIERLQNHPETDELEPFLTAVRSGSRSSYSILQKFVGAYGVVEDANGRQAVIPHALRDGLSPTELHTLCVGARTGQARAVAELAHLSHTLRQSHLPTGYGVLARAMRSRHPGLVFARAAAAGQTDPLTDLDSRMFTGQGAVVFRPS